MLLTFYRVTIIFLLLHCPYAIATDPSTLPLGTVLDDKGQPLTIPTQNKTALSYSTPPAVNSSHNIKTPLSKPKSKYKKSVVNNSLQAVRTWPMTRAAAGLMAA